MRKLTKRIIATNGWRLSRQLFVDPVRRATARARAGDRIPVGYCDIANWGDALNSVLVELLSGRAVQHLEGVHHERYLVVGSVLDAANARAEVWGSGFIKDGQNLTEPPKAIHAVRGPLTRAALLSQGIACPEIFGDPALLFPRFYDPVVPKRFRLGIVPHYVDSGHPWVQAMALHPDVRVIDIQSGVFGFVEQLKSCEAIASSSLHGLIAADAYGVPNLQILLSDKLIGGNFKFRDYRLSIGVAEPDILAVSRGLKVDDVISRCELHVLDIDLVKLLLACPFLSDDLRNAPTAVRLPSESLAGRS